MNDQFRVAFQASTVGKKVKRKHGPVKSASKAKKARTEQPGDDDSKGEDDEDQLRENTAFYDTLVDFEEYDD